MMDETQGNSTNQESRQVRQGHIVLDPAPLPRSAVLAPNFIRGHAVIGSGESGREHVFKSDWVSVLQGDGYLYIEVRGKPAILEHPEHGQIEVPEGIYRVIDQVEADGDEEEMAGTGTRFSYD